jgi:hypothetical protein
MRIQAKLRIGAVDDLLEREADRAAEALLAGGPIAAPSAAQSECASCAAEAEELSVRRVATAPPIGVPAGAAAPPEVHEALRSPGQPLGAATRAYFEQRFGHDFSRVRIHAGSKAAEAASSVQARAYANGRHIVFAAGEYAPDTAEGKRLLAHELTHVIQHTSANANRLISCQPSGKKPEEKTEKKPEKPTGTQVLYVRPEPPKQRKIKGVEYSWSFDTQDGRREYEAALDKHLKKNGTVSGDTTYEPLSGSADIAKLASKKAANLILIVHGAGDAPAIAVDLGNPAAGVKGDWIKEDKFAEAIAPLAYKDITILGCDTISNKFAPDLAKHLPKGSTIGGHGGGSYEIKRHFEPNEKTGRLQLTHLTSNLKVKHFKTEGASR